MRSPETFDAYYVETRTRLLHEAYALTGDAPASRAAVRDAFVVAWHRWRKVGQLEDRDGYVRPLALGRARRRHTARIWHRDKSLDPEVRSTLDALSKLTARQRELLVLNGISALSLGEVARTVGLPRADAERELQTASSQFSLHRDAPTTDIPRLLHALDGPLEDIRWPRATVIRRAGAARRRTHTVIGAGLATAALAGLRLPGRHRRRRRADEPEGGEGHARRHGARTRRRRRGRGDDQRRLAALPGPAHALRVRARLDRDRHHRQPRRRRPARAVPARAVRRPRRRHRPRPHLGGHRDPRRAEEGRQGRPPAHPQAGGDRRAGDRRPDGRDVAQRAPGGAGLRDRVAVVRRMHRPAHPAHGHPHREARRRRGTRLPAAVLGQAAGHPHRRHGPHRQPRGHPGRAQPRPGRPRQGGADRARRRRQRRVRVRGRRRLRGPRAGQRHPAARDRYAAGAALGGRPAAGRRRPRPLGRHGARAGAQQLRRHPLRPDHLPGQGHQQGPDPHLPLPRDGRTPTSSASPRPSAR